MTVMVEVDHLYKTFGALTAVNGISLTVNTVSGNVFTMNLIPHTLSHTNLQFLVVGSRVNLEIDQIARYVERMTEWATDNPK